MEMDNSLRTNRIDSLGNTISGINSVVIDGNNNIVSGDLVSIIRSEDSRISGSFSTITYASNINISGMASSVMHGDYNSIIGDYSSLSHGERDRIEGNSSSISHGNNNFIIGDQSSISNGNLNNVRGDGSAITNSSESNISGNESNIIGGQNQSIRGDMSVVLGGIDNKIDGSNSGIYNGNQCAITGDYSHVTGLGNVTSVDGALIAGMYNEDDGVFVIGGGDANDRSNLLSMNEYGDMYVSGDITLASDSVVNKVFRADKGYIAGGMLYVLIYMNNQISRGVSADKYVQEEGDIVKYVIITMKILHNSKRFIKRMISTDDGFQYIYKPNPDYDPKDVIITTNRRGMALEYIDDGEYPLLIEYEEYVPDHWDRLHEQTVGGKDYVWYRLNE